MQSSPKVERIPSLFALSVLTLFALTGCGGGGGSSASNSITATPTPIIASEQKRSPNGQYIAYIPSGGFANPWVHIQNADGSNDHVLQRATYNASSLTWSPDGILLAWINTTSNNSSTNRSHDTIRIGNPATGEIHELVGVGGQVKNILQITEWTTDNKIRFMANYRGGDCTTGPCVDVTPIFEINADGTGLHLISGTLK